MTVNRIELLLGGSDQLEGTARLFAAARGEELNAVVCEALRDYVEASR